MLLFALTRIQYKQRRDKWLAKKTAIAITPPTFINQYTIRFVYLWLNQTETCSTIDISPKICPLLLRARLVLSSCSTELDAPRTRIWNINQEMNINARPHSRQWDIHRCQSQIRETNNNHTTTSHININSLPAAVIGICEINHRQMLWEQVKINLKYE